MKHNSPKPPPTIERLKEVLDYNPETGEFSWLVGGKGIKPGSRPGYLDRSTGYFKLMIDKRNHYAHRLAWLLVHGVIPAGQIDHINGCRTDNRISNLRIATHAENCRNHQKRPMNTTGFKGVVRHQGRFRAQIKSEGKCFHLGSFDTPEGAHAAYCDAASKLFGKFARFQ